ncbi:MAG: hypothetical protein ACYC0V_07565 [Armatimonadota bacterium]
MFLREYKCNNPNCTSKPKYIQLPNTDIPSGPGFELIEQSSGEDMLFAQECQVCHNGDLVPGLTIVVPDK